MPVNTRHKDYDYYFSIWEKCRDANEGTERVKQQRVKYLPALNGQTPDGYESYLQRAVYTNFTARTMQTSIGQLFRKNPIVSGVDDVLVQDVNLQGESLIFFSKNIAKEIMLTDRVGIFVDYSDIDKRAYLAYYRAESIINWQTKDNQLSRVVLEGEIEEPDPADIFRLISRKVWRELYLDDDGIYQVRDWRQANKDNGDIYFSVDNEYTPVMNDGALDFIPFYIITSRGISTSAGRPQILDFVNLNLAHYINSADFENMLHWTGAKTVITKGWGDRPFPVGGCADFAVDGGAVFLEASSDSGLKDEMRHKEEQMATLGASLISGKGRYVASAETSRLTSEGEYATLADLSNSLSDSMTKIMQLANEWSGIFQDVIVEYNTDFETNEIDSATLVSLMGAVQSGYMSMETFFYNLKNKEVYPREWTLEQELAAIADTMKQQIERRETLTPYQLQGQQPTQDQSNQDQSQDDNQDEETPAE